MDAKALAREKERKKQEKLAQKKGKRQERVEGRFPRVCYRLWLTKECPDPKESYVGPDSIMEYKNNDVSLVGYRMKLIQLLIQHGADVKTMVVVEIV